MAIIDELITDRTQADVDAVKALADKIKSGSFTAADILEFNLPSKGAYNFEDLNRVGKALIFLAELLTESGYPVSVDVKTDWTMSDIPRINDIAAYLQQVDKIRNALNIVDYLPETPTTILTVEQANDIEKIIESTYDFLQNMIAEYRYSNTFYSGEDNYR